MSNHQLTLSGTCGGMLLSILPQVTTEDVYRTIALAAVGAVTSFLISYVLKKMLEDHDPKDPSL
ncbi:hypothetical protein [Mesonia aestuariivivens]|uniref:Holin n=1 Tax=Mesonia aestuariivivens TaxID=2796128 RepID=A0ABS6W5I1_9FLAO|nr:hypothetical protein [Mesonia aestuariivivens]MBW2962741.1 hypothetical protein [Mesonia aestuariivivens]